MRCLVGLFAIALFLVVPSDGAEVLKRFDVRDQTTFFDAAVDDLGDIYACGITERPAVIPKAVRVGTELTGASAFLMKVASNGTVISSVVFGSDVEYTGLRLGLLRTREVVLAGTTRSRNLTGTSAPTPLPAARGSLHFFVTKVDATGTNLVYNRIFGGSDYEVVTALTADADGNVFLGGTTAMGALVGKSPTLIPSRSTTWSFVLKLSPDASTRDYVRIFGEGGARTGIRDILTDTNGIAYVAGSTDSQNLPTKAAIQEIRPIANSSCAFLAGLRPDGTVLFSTFLAGESSDSADALALDQSGHILVSGTTFSAHFPAEPFPLLIPSGPLVRKAFVLELSSSGQEILRSTIFPPGSQSGPGVARLKDGRIVVDASLEAAAISGFGLIGSNGVGSIVLDPLIVKESSIRTASCLDAAENIIATSRLAIGAQFNGSILARYAQTEFPEAPVPEIRLATPRPGVWYPPQRPVSIQAVFSGTTGVVQSVTFLAGRKVLGTVTNEPYSMTWSNALRGVYNLTAVAEVDGHSIKSRPIRITVASPHNDDFARRLRLTGESVDIEGKTSGATYEFGEDYSSVFPWWYPGGASSVWFSWTAPADGVYEFLLESEPPLSSLHSGSISTETAPGSFDSTAYLNPRRPLTLRLRLGVERFIRIASSPFAESPGNFRLRIRRVTPPLNDDLEQAIAISLTTDSVSVDSLVDHASLEPGEQDWSGFGVGSVWYRWIAPSDGKFLVAPDVAASSLIARLVVLGGIGLSVTNLDVVDLGHFGSITDVEFDAQEGVTYWIAVMGIGPESVRWTLSRVPAPPANDNFFDRLPIPNGLTSVTGTLVGATIEIWEPAPAYDPSVWWSWQPTESGLYNVSLRYLDNAGGGVASLGVNVYAGEHLHALQAVARPQSFVDSGVLVQAIAGVSYSILARGYFSRFAIDILPVDGVPNDDFANAVALSGSAVAVDGSCSRATFEPGEPDATFSSTTEASVWYRWIAPSNGTFVVNAMWGAVRLYVGDDLSDLAPVETTLGGHFNASAGVEYRIAVITFDRFTLRLRPAFVSPNDSFANRQIIPSLGGTFAPEAPDATREQDEPSSSAYNSVWYSWTAPSAGSWLLSPGGQIYIGDTLSNLVAVETTLEAGGVSFYPVAGLTYHIGVQAAYYSSLQPLVYALRRQTPPANDNFADRISLRGRSVKITASNIGATREPEDFEAVRTVWWSWRSPANGVATFLVNPNPVLYDSFLGRLAVFTGDELPTLAPLGEGSVVAIPVEAGRDYQIAVGNLPSAYSGTFELQIIFDPGPSNDAFADRKPLDVFAVGTLLGSTIEPDEPAIAAGLGSVWWSWTPRTTGVYELRLDLLEGLLPFHINGWELYAGDALNELEAVETHGPTWTRYRVEAGVRYAVRVTGRPGISKFRLRAEFQAPPENDSFARRIVLRGPNATSTGSTANATAEPDEFSHSSPNAWWTWTAPGKGAARVTIDDPYCHGIVVHIGNRLTNLSSIVESYEPTGATFLTEPGRAYQIEVRGESCGDLRLTFDLSLKFYPTPANDDFADRILLAGTNVTVTNAVLLGSRMEEGEPRVALNGLFSAWWQWTALQTGRYVFEPLPGDIPVTFVLFTGTNLATLTQVAASEWSSSSVNVALAEGTSLAIVAQSEAGFPRERFRWRIRLTTAPANDDFAGRIEIDGPNMQGTLEGSTLDVGDPLFLASSSIWWSLTPTNSGWREILVAAVPYGNADFRVFRGTNLEDLRMISPRGVRSSPFPYFWMEAGESYAIEVAGFAGWFGPVNLAVRFFTTATNDWFTNAIVIPSGGGVLMASNTLCHIEPLEPRHSSQELNSVWWKWTAPATGDYSFTLGNTSQFGFIDIYTGTELSNLTRGPEVHLDLPSEDYLFQAAEGVTYWIAVTTHTEGTIEFHLAPHGSPPMVGAAIDIQRNGAKSVSTTLTIEGPSLILVAPDPIRAWVIESSTDLRQWVPVVTNKVGTLQFSIEPIAGDAKRFFRVRMD